LIILVTLITSYADFTYLGRKNTGESTLSSRVLYSWWLTQNPLVVAKQQS
ncbi:hypothetical protein NDU88_003735, partial [Pleurodeles waltl]